MTIRPSLCGLLILAAVVCAGDVLAGPPFKTDDPQPVDFRHWEFYIASMQEFERHAASATLPHIEINYGVVPGVQLHVVAPVEYVHADDAVHYGYSDTELGVKYRFIEETETLQDLMRVFETLIGEKLSLCYAFP